MFFFNRCIYLYSDGQTNQLDLAGPPQSTNVSELFKHSHKVNYDDGRQSSLWPKGKAKTTQIKHPPQPRDNELLNVSSALPTWGSGWKTKPMATTTRRTTNDDNRPAIWEVSAANIFVSLNLVSKVWADTQSRSCRWLPVSFHQCSPAPGSSTLSKWWQRFGRKNWWSCRDQGRLVPGIHTCKSQVSVTAFTKSGLRPTSHSAEGQDYKN